ncbi:hypothetical protein GJ496_002719 [Pomphorhynchus laevis]|nr:hypothetical protein GJ496_002719 [Pomphorhynchus laevis]
MGPAGLYAAREILKVGNHEITMFEQDRQPFGLLKWGVAPDRPEYKRLIPEFDRFLSDNKQRISIHYNQRISDWKKLVNNFDRVIAAVGAPLTNSLPMSHCNSPDLSNTNVLSGLKFAELYNGKGCLHSVLGVRKCKHVVIIGFGNVSLDCGRMLFKVASSMDVNIPLEFATNFKNLQKVTFVCRKPTIWQQSCSVKEFRELFKLCKYSIEFGKKPDLLVQPPASSSRSQKRLYEFALKCMATKNESFFNILLGEELKQVDTGNDYVNLVLESGINLSCDVVIYCLGQRPAEIESDERIVKMGWCFRNGKGTVSDCYHDAHSFAAFLAKSKHFL